MCHMLACNGLHVRGGGGGGGRVHGFVHACMLCTLSVWRCLFTACLVVTCDESGDLISDGIAVVCRSMIWA